MMTPRTPPPYNDPDDAAGVTDEVTATIEEGPPDEPEQDEAEPDS